MSDLKFDFSNKVVIVTGGSSGIGREAALSFAAGGAKVVIADVNEDLALKTVHQIKEAGGDSFFCKCDVSQPDSVKNLVGQTVDKYGKLNLACNDAGIEGPQANITDVSLESWDKIINTNLRGVWLCMKYQIPEILKANGGAIVNVSSIAGLVGFSGLSTYTASKHGVIGLTKTAALEFAEKNIRINAVCPGPIMTPMLQRLADSTPGFKDQIIAGVPERKIGQPADIAQAILFLCSDQSTYITGQSLAIDGGWVAQ